MEDFYEQTTPMPAKNNGVLGGFVDWYDNLDEAKRSALTTGLMSAGLKMMEAGGRSYDRPVSGLSVVGTGGLTGLNEYHNTLEQERNYGLRKDFLGVQKDYLGMSKDRFEAERPYMADAARMDNEMRGLQIQKAKEPTLVRGSRYGYYMIKGGNDPEFVPPMTGLGKPEYTYAQALDRKSKIVEKIDKLESGGPLNTESLGALPPKTIEILMGISKTRTNAETRKAAIQAYKEQLKYIEDNYLSTRKPSGGDLSPEEKRQIYKETWGLMKNGADGAFSREAATGGSWKDYDY